MNVSRDTVYKWWRRAQADPDGQWWLDRRKFKKDQVAAHLVNLAWNGLSGLERTPRLVTLPRR